MMAGVVRLPMRPATPPGRITPPLASEVNRVRIVQVAARLADHFQNSAPLDHKEFFELCFSLSRGIDYAVSHSDIPPNTTNLPPVLKKVYDHRYETLLQPAVMVLLISAKNACRNGWFPPPESEEILAMAHEVSNTFCWAKNMTPEEKHTLQLVSNITSRFYPQMELSRLFASFEVKSGYEILVADVYIPRNINREERIYLFVAQIDNMETSNCIISPPQAKYDYFFCIFLLIFLRWVSFPSFMVNGRGVDKRTNVSMEYGPQLPSDITKLLKYGMNLFQAVGSFHGNYIIAIAVITSSNIPDALALQDYVKPIVPMAESDSEIIEGASRISLNCPISFKRINTPVKGHLCKHYQCFDFKNFLEINSRKPSWRCPCCIQSVSYNNLRLDRFMEKIIKEAGDVSDIVISADGTWEVFGDHLVNPPLMHNKALTEISDGIPAGETIDFSINASDVVDLTVEDYIGPDGSGNLESSDDVVIQDGSTSGIEERKPSRIKADFPTSSGAYFRHTSGVTYTQVSNEIPNEMNLATHDGVSNGQVTSILGPSTSDDSSISGLDVVSFPPSHGNSSSHDVLLPIPSPTALGTQLQQSRFGNLTSSIGTERQPIPRNVSRIPVAVQALPILSQHQASQKRTRTSENGGDLISSASTISELQGPRFHNPASPSGFPGQIIGLPGVYQGDSAVAMKRMRGSLMQSCQSAVQLPTSLHQTSQGALGTFHDARRKMPDHLLAGMGTSQAGSPRGAPAIQASRISPPSGEQEQVNLVLPQSLCRLATFPSEQNWRPTARMRGALTGSEYAAVLRHYLEQPSPSTHAASNPSPTHGSSNPTGTGTGPKIGVSASPSNP